jgi:hypothetical protein
VPKISARSPEPATTLHAEGEHHQEGDAPEHPQRLVAQGVPEDAAQGAGREIAADGRDLQRRRGGRDQRLVARQRRGPAAAAAPGGRRLRLGAEGREARGEHQQRHAGPQQPVPEQRADERRQGGVALGDRPVAGRQIHRGAAEGIEQGAQPLALDVGEHQAGGDVGAEEHHDADVGHQPAARPRGEGEEEGSRQQQVGQHHHREREEIRRGARRPQALRLQPGHEAAHEDAQGADDHDAEARQQRPQEAAAEVGAPRQRLGEEELVRPALEVAQRRAGDEGGRDEDGNDTHHREELQDDEWRVAMDVADRAADADRVRGHGAEGEQGEEQRRAPEEGRAQLVAQLEAEDLGEHAPPSPPAYAGLAVPRRAWK